MKRYRQRLAHYLRTRRGKEGQVAFAQRLGLSQSTLQRIEKADQNVSLDTLEVICTHLDCDMGDLFPPLPEEGQE